MNESEFVGMLDRDGYREQERREFPRGMSNTDHTHPWDARLLVLKGQLTVSFPDGPRTFLPGEFCEVPAGTVHHEIYGDGGSELYIGRRK